MEPGKKGGLTHTLHVIQLPVETIREELQKALLFLSWLKKDPNIRDTWLGQLIDAQAQATGWKNKILWKQIKSREHI